MRRGRLALVAAVAVAGGGCSGDDTGDSTTSASMTGLPTTTATTGTSSTSTGEGTESSGVVQITSDLTKSVEGKHVLIIEDIVDTGLTMQYLLQNLETRKPASVKLASLLHKPARSKVKIPIDYLGFEIEDVFVIGYGLDYDQHYRNLPYLGVMRPE